MWDLIYFRLVLHRWLNAMLQKNVQGCQLMELAFRPGVNTPPGVTAGEAIRSAVSGFEAGRIKSGSMIQVGSRLHRSVNSFMRLLRRLHNSGFEPGKEGSQVTDDGGQG